MTQPNLLKKGDKIAIVAPAGAVDINNVLWAKTWLEKQGFEVILGKHFASPKTYFSGTVQQRLQDFQVVLNDKSVKAVFCARGGYGSVDIIDDLKFKKFRENPKWIVGFSDITLLLNHIVTNYQVQTIHGPMPNSFKTTSDDSLKALMQILTKGKIDYKTPLQNLSNLKPLSGLLIGGNLSILNSIMGSKSMPKPKDSILFLEDIGEYQYHIHRMLMMLKRAGYLKPLNGILLGAFTDMKDTKKPFGCSFQNMIKELIAEYKYPVYSGFPAGHIDRNLPLIIGADTHVSQKGLSPVL